MRNTLLGIVFLIGLFSNLYSHAQSKNPPCPTDGAGYWDSCFSDFTDQDGNKFVGQWKSNKPDGQGILTFSGGNKYAGQFKSGKFHGQGTFTWIDGSKYVGQWKDNNHHGQGTLYKANGSIINQGIWEDDKFIRSEALPQATLPKVTTQPTSQQIKQKKCIQLGLIPGSEDYKKCIN